VSHRGLPKRAHICWLPPGKSDGPAGAIRRFWLVGKQSKISNCNTSGSILFVEKWSSCLGVFHRLCSMPDPPQQGAHLGRLPCAGQTRSAELRLLKSNCSTAAARSIHKAFSCKDFLRGVRSTSLTRRRSERKMAPRSGTSKRSPLCKSPNGPVAGLSPEIVESAV